MKKKRQIKWFIIIAVAVLVVAMVVLTFTYNQEKLKNGKSNILNKNIASDVTEMQDDEKITSYVSETSYTGNGMPEDLYKRPFSDDSSEYIANKDLVKKDDETDLTGYLNTANSYMEFLFGNNYREILNDQDAFIDKYLSYKKDSETASVSAGGSVKTEKQRAEDIMEWYVDNKTEISCDFVTDMSLIYEKNYSYVVRGELDISCYNKKACKSFKKLFGTKLTYKGTDRYMVELYFVPGEPGQIWQMQILNKLGGD